VRVVASLRDEEDLALQADRRRRLVELDDLGDLLELVADAGGREDRVDRRVDRERREMSSACWVVVLAPAIIVAVVVDRAQVVHRRLARDRLGRAVEAVEHETLVSDPVPIASGRFRPTQNVEAPEIDVIVGKPPPPPLHVATASAARPPQPVAILMSARPLCHAWIWSEWEKSANGFGNAAVHVLGLAHRVDERAGVGHDGELVRVVEALELDMLGWNPNVWPVRRWPEC
jgi:hypothetical protein